MSELSSEPSLNQQIGTLSGDTPLGGSGALGELTFDNAQPGVVEQPKDPMADLHIPTLGSKTTTTTTADGQVVDPGGAPAPKGLVGYAKKFLGTPYVWGGTSPSGFDCVRADSFVSTPGGPVAIRDICMGQSVYSFIGGRQVVRPVTRVIPKGVQKSLKVRTRNRTLFCTPGHELPILKKSRGFGTPNEWRVEWTRAEDVTRDDVLVIQRELPDNGRESMSAEDAWILGLWTGDGHLDDRHVFICVYGDTAHRVIAWANSKGANARLTESAGVTINSKDIANWLRGLGCIHGSHVKRVPAAILSAGWKIQKSFCDGYLEADGHVDRKGWETYSSCNEGLLKQVRYMLIGMGEQVSNLRKTERTKDIFIKGRQVLNPTPLYSMQAYPNTRVGNQTLLKNFGARRAFLDAGFTCERVLDVSDDEPAEMYDISVEEAENFVADGVLVHNCSGFVQYVYAHFGVHLPRVSADQARAGKRVGFGDLRPGDLVAVDNSSRNSGADHIGIYVGNGMVIDAPHPGASVQLDHLSAFGGGWGVRIKH